MGIDVSGGVGGTGAVLDELEVVGARLRAAAGSVAEAAGRVAAAVLAGDLVETHALSPLTAVRADAALVEAAGPAGLAGDAVELETLGSAVWAATAAYRAGDAAVAASLEVAQDEVMRVLGRAAPELLVGVLALDALGVDVAGVLDRAVYDLPALAGLGGGVAGLAEGLAEDPVTAPLLLPGRVARHQGETGLAGQPLGEDERALRVLADSAALLGLFDDRGRARVVPEAAARVGAVAPTDLATLARDQANLSDAEDYPGRVRVVEVPRGAGAGAAWVLEVSGTQAWDPHAGSSPFDVTTDVRLMAQQSTVLASGATQALALAQAASGRDTSGEPVMLVGHSLGGMVAAGLAASPRFRTAHGQLSVVTLGSPVSRMPVPDSVSVLSLEHVQDAVPRLDGRGNPDRERWVTVSRDLRGDDDEVDTATGAHATKEYVETAAEADASDTVSMQAWRQDHAAFFTHGAETHPVVRDYRVERVLPPG